MKYEIPLMLEHAGTTCTSIRIGIHKYGRAGPGRAAHLANSPASFGLGNGLTWGPRSPNGRSTIARSRRQ